MSKITNPTKESSVTAGFFNSLNGDRKYDAIQMSSLFDGIIKDGIFASIGSCFVVNASDKNIVTVGTGKAWFDHTWTNNDAILPIQCEDSESLLDRIDAIVIEVNSSDSVRDNFIKAIKGKPSSNPDKPSLENSNTVHQYPLCYIYRKAGSTEITQAEITNMVGTDATPFITGILQTISLDTLLGQWRAELNQFVNCEKDECEKILSSISKEFGNWTDSEKKTIIDWFNRMKGQLSTDAAINLQLQIDNSEIERILSTGLLNGKKVFSNDGKKITITDSTGRKLIKTFSDDFSTCNSTLYDSNGTIIATMIKRFSENGNVTDTEVNII